MESSETVRQSIWFDPAHPGKVFIIDQRFLPHKIKIETLDSLEDTVTAIRDMHLRGAPLIGVAAAYGMYLACCRNASFDPAEIGAYLTAARPTAVNLKWAVNRQLEAIKGLKTYEREAALLAEAREIEREDIETCRMIGVHGLPLIQEIAQRKNGEPVRILTHCNAGWLACVQWGTKTSPIYHAHEKGIPLHVWVDETRPRNQGAQLTAWELSQRGISHQVIVDNLGGQLMQTGQVDLVLVGSDRTTRTGDVANKVGTYLKALAAFDNRVPFYVCLPSSTIDWQMRDGLKEIPIEERHEDEVHEIQGLHDGELKSVRITPPQSAAYNLGFDVTPARLVTGLITERGIAPASEKGLLELFPEKGAPRD